MDWLLAGWSSLASQTAVCQHILVIFLMVSHSLTVTETHWRRQWHPTPVLLPGKSHGRRSLVGCSPWGRWGLDTTQWLHFHFSLSCFGEGNGNPLQCSCLENPRDGGAWWAAIYGVEQSWTRLKWLSRENTKGSFKMFTYIKWILKHLNHCSFLDISQKQLIVSTTCISITLYLKGLPDSVLRN